MKIKKRKIDKEIEFVYVFLEPSERYDCGQSAAIEHRGGSSYYHPNW